MTYKIEKGVEMPQRRSGPRASSKYPFSQMEVGESFFVGASDAPREKIYAAASSYGLRNGKKFSVRKTDDGIRCWRIK